MDNKELARQCVDDSLGVARAFLFLGSGVAGSLVLATMALSPLTVASPVILSSFFFLSSSPSKRELDKIEKDADPKLLKKYLSKDSQRSLIDELKQAKKALPPIQPGAINPPAPVPHPVELEPVRTPAPLDAPSSHPVRVDSAPVPHPIAHNPAPVEVQKWEPIISESTNDDDYGWIDSILQYPNWLIFGGQGSGKSTFTKWLLQQRKANGDRVIVIDPHAAKGDWEGVEVFGAGKKFGQVETALKWVIREVDRRYEIRAKEGDDALKNEPFVTVACEEMTNWKDEIEPDLLSKFDGVLTADIRKAKFRAVKLSHAKTQTATGGKAGLAETKQNYVRLNLKSRPDPNSPDGVSPAFEATLTRPQGLPERVKINPDWKPFTVPVMAATEEEPKPDINQATDAEILALFEDGKKQKEVHDFYGVKKSGSSKDSCRIRELWREFQGRKNADNVIEFSAYSGIV